MPAKKKMGGGGCGCGKNYNGAGGSAASDAVLQGVTAQSLSGPQASMFGGTRVAVPASSTGGGKARKTKATAKKPSASKKTAKKKK
jgi:hypothetical protein